MGTSRQRLPRVPPESSVPTDVAADPAAKYYDFNQPSRFGAFNATNASVAFAEAKGFDATWSWFDGATYMVYGNEISMDVSTVTVDVFGVERSTHARGARRRPSRRRSRVTKKPSSWIAG